MKIIRISKDQGKLRSNSKGSVLVPVSILENCDINSGDIIYAAPRGRNVVISKNKKNLSNDITKIIVRKSNALVPKHLFENASIDGSNRKYKLSASRGLFIIASSR